MRTFLLKIFFLVSTNIIVVGQQNSSVSIGTDKPKGNAVLLLHSPNHNQGLIIPIASKANVEPEAGMILFDETDKSLYYYNGTSWVSLSGAGGSVSGLSLEIQGNSIRLLDGANLLHTTPITPIPTSGYFMTWNGSQWTPLALSGDVSGSNGSLQVTGLLGKGLPALPNVTKALAFNGNSWTFESLSALPILNNGQVLVGNGAINSGVIMSGDATINSSTGALTISDNAINTQKIADGAVNDSKISSVTALKINGLPPNMVPRSNGTSLMNSSILNDGNSTSIIGALYLSNALAVGSGSDWGSPGQILTSNGIGSPLSWTSISGDASLFPNGTLTLNPNVVNSGNIMDGTVSAFDIASSAITSPTILDGTILAQDLNSMGATTGQVLKFNGTNWAPAPDNVGVGSVPTLLAGQILLGDGTTNFAQTLSGDATLSNTGVVTISNDAIGSAEIADGSIVNTDIANDAISSIKIADNTITSSDITDGTIIESDIADDAVTGAKIAPMGASNGQVLKYNTGTGLWEPGNDNSGAGSVPTLTNGQILMGDGTSNFAQSVSGDAVMANTGVLSISNNAIGSAEITDGSIANTDIANDAITSAKIADGTIAAIDIANDAVISTKIANDAVGGDKIAPMSATNGQVLKYNTGTGNWEPGTDNTGGVVALNSSQILVGDVSNNAVAVSMSGDATISNTGVVTISNDAIGSAEITDGSITTNDLLDGTITGQDLAGNISINTTGFVSASDLNVNLVDYTWPSMQGAANTYLKNDGTGILSWSVVAGGGFSSLNVIPKGDGSGMIDSRIKDDGTTIMLGTTTPDPVYFMKEECTSRVGFRIDNSYSGGSSKTGFYYSDQNNSTGDHYFSQAFLSSNNINSSVIGSKFTLTGTATGLGTPSNLIGAQYIIQNNGGDGGVYGNDVQISKSGSDYGLGYLYRGSFSSDQSTSFYGPGLGRFGIHLTNETFNYLSGSTKLGGLAPVTGTVTTLPTGKLHIVTGNSTDGQGWENVAIRIEDNTGQTNSWAIYKRSDNHNLVLATGNYANGGNPYLALAPTVKGYFAFANGAYTNSSDRRLKKNISPLPGILSQVLKLSPRFYHFNDQNDSDPLNVGFIAQEVKEVLPYLVDYDKANDKYAIAYSNFGVIAIKAIQEQQEIIERQEVEIKSLRESIEKLKSIEEDVEKLKVYLEIIKKGGISANKGASNDK